MVKRYKIEYWDGDRSKPSYLTQLSKLGKRDGLRICFWDYEKKDWQDNWKNGLANGLDKEWRSNSKNWNFRNWKKGKSQGIRIQF